jgi:hypothetical protein
MKILLDFNDIGKEDFKSVFGNESLHKISNNIAVRVVNFAMSKNPSQKYSVTTSQHPEIYLGISRWETPNQTDHILIQMKAFECG